jgi:hypothetical protein
VVSLSSNVILSLTQLILAALVWAIDARDSSMYEHAKRVPGSLALLVRHDHASAR